MRFRRVRFQTPSSVSFFAPHRAPGRELSEFLSAYYLCAKANSPSFSQNSPSLPQNSVSSLFGNSTLETVLRPVSKKFWCTGTSPHSSKMLREFVCNNQRALMWLPVISRSRSGSRSEKRWGRFFWQNESLDVGNRAIVIGF